MHAHEHLLTLCISSLILLHTADLQRRSERRCAKGKDLGLFATNDVPQGTRISAETAIATSPPGDKSTEDIWRQFEEMSDAQSEVA